MFHIFFIYNIYKIYIIYTETKLFYFHRMFKFVGEVGDRAEVQMNPLNPLIDPPLEWWLMLI